jgi:hypothetical protein
MPIARWRHGLRLAGTRGAPFCTSCAHVTAQPGPSTFG